MSEFYNLPQEICFEISEFGQIHPSLSAEYCLREIEMLCSKQDLNVRDLLISELILQEMRRQSESYNALKDLLSSLPRRCVDHWGIAQRLWDDDHRIIREWGDPRYMYSANVYPAILVYNMDISSIPEGYQFHRYPYRNSVVIRMDDVGPNVTISEARYLMNPRTYTQKGDGDGWDHGRVYFNSRYLTRGDYEFDNDSDLSDILNGVESRGEWIDEYLVVDIGDMSNIDIMGYIIREYPEYNLGDILQWLRDRLATLNRVKDTELYKLCTSHSLGMIDCDGYEQCNIFVHSRSDDTLNAFTRYLSELGFNVERDNDNNTLACYPEDDEYNSEEACEFMETITSIRMTMMNYLPCY